MKNNYQHYSSEQYKKDELLAIIASNLELDQTRKEQMESAYRGVSEVFEEDRKFLNGISKTLYPQGSLLIGTSIKPLPDKEFDLDIVLRIEDSYRNHSPKNIYDGLFQVLASHGTYAPLLEKKNRCVRLKYNSDFHMDILPGCMINSDHTRIMIPYDKTLSSWSRTDPKGYAAWFKEISERQKSNFLLSNRYLMLAEANVDTEELPRDLYAKTPLQRTVQIVKRYRDLYYRGKDLKTTPAVSSIVLTTLLAQCHNDELSVQGSLINAVRQMRKFADEYRNRRIRFSVYNPVDLNPETDKRETFTDSWTDKHYDSFAGFALDFERKVNDFLNNPTNEGDYKNLFGNGYFKDSIQKHIKLEEALNGNPRLAAILAGKAKTDRMGNINVHKGINNGNHGFFAEP